MPRYLLYEILDPLKSSAKKDLLLVLSAEVLIVIWDVPLLRNLPGLLLDVLNRARHDRMPYIQLMLIWIFDSLHDYPVEVARDLEDKEILRLNLIVYELQALIYPEELILINVTQLIHLSLDLKV